MTRPWALSLAMSVVLLLPASVHAAAAIVQDSCTVVGDSLHRMYFTVRAPDIEEGVCALMFVPEPQPPRRECTIAAASGPWNWVWGLNADGSLWFSVPPFDRRGCVGDSNGGFDLTFPGGYCCYTVQYYDFYFRLAVEQEECFTCGTVPIEPKTWGNLKARYRD